MSDNIPGPSKKGTESTEERKGSRKRKQPNPRRAAERNDPNFRGASVTYDLLDLNEEPTLYTTVEFQPSSLAPKSKRRPRKTTTSIDCGDSSDSSTKQTTHPVYPSHTNCPREKHCASCSARKTPLWRDAEDGTPLCNACGIRYKKYKIRCAQCWHIPKKDECSPSCKFCGSKFQYSFTRAW